MKPHRAFLLGLTLLLAIAAIGRTQDQAKKPADATGNWKWTVAGQDGQTWESTGKFKQDGEKLTGTVTGRDGTDAAIVDGTIKNNELNFTVKRDFGGTPITLKYNGKIDGDTIKGKTEVNFGGGDPISLDWDAKRAKDTPATKPA